MDWDSIGRSGSSRRKLRAAYEFDDETVNQLKQAATRDRAELPTMSAVLSYCLKLGVETYLAGQLDDEPASPVKE